MSRYHTNADSNARIVSHYRGIDDTKYFGMIADRVGNVVIDGEEWTSHDESMVGSRFFMHEAKYAGVALYITPGWFLVDDSTRNDILTAEDVGGHQDRQTWPGLSPDLKLVRTNVPDIDAAAYRAIVEHVISTWREWHASLPVSRETFDAETATDDDVTEEGVARQIMDMLDVMDRDAGPAVTRMESFEDAGVLTKDVGFRLTLSSGDVFDITVTRGR